ncbi:MAG: ornithine cyclodeaminase family protein [Bacteroidota bacterium]
MATPLFIDSDFIETNNSFVDLVHALKKAFAIKSTIVPQRHHHDFPSPGKEKHSTLLLMPAWNPGEDSGVKVVTINPYNGDLGLPAIQGSYMYMDASNGQLKAIIEAKNLTAKRTAATSALASQYMSRKDADSLLMIGTGVLSINLIRAHAAVRPIKKVYIWGRSFEKAKGISDQLQGETYAVEAIKKINAAFSKVAIISCATLSESPLVLGSNLIPGQHLDLVGAYKPNMREADDVAIQRSMVFVDAFGGSLKESGDIAIPLRTGVLKEKDIMADLFGLCSNQKLGRTGNNQITLFKSVGHALEDLTAARYYYQKYANDNV